MKYRRVYAICLYVIAIALSLRYITFELNPNYTMELYERFLFTTFACGIGYWGSCLLAKGRSMKKRCKIMRTTFFIFFVWYVILLLTLTLFDPMMGRTVQEPWSYDAMVQYAKETVNIIPFRMIRIYWYGYVNKQITLAQFLMNMAGNMMLLMPMGFFLPMFFKNIRTWKNYILATLSIVLLIELTQMVSMCGYFDVDDIGLNMLGAIIAYAIMRIPAIDKWYQPLTKVRK